MTHVERSRCFFFERFLNLLVTLGLGWAPVGCGTPSASESEPPPKESPAEPPRVVEPEGEPEAETDEAGKHALALGTHGTITSKVLGEDRRYLVYTPDSYAGSDRPLPVLYLLDGEAHFHHVTGMVDFLGSTGRIPPMIVVGLANTVRSRDFTPSHREEVAHSGGADNFLRFLETELIPEIDGQYRTQSFRILVGHSFGGLVTMYTFIEKPELFGAYLAISPSMHWDDELLLRRAQKRWADGHGPKGFLYFALGNEPENITKANQKFSSFLTTQAPAELTWSFDSMADENHSTIPHRAILNGVDKLFADWRLPAAMDDPQAIAAHYQALSKRLGLPAEPPETALNLLGYRLLGEKRIPEAIEVFRIVVATYPKSPNAYDSLGEGLETSGQTKEALANYERAVELGTAQGHPQLEVFTQNRDRVRKQTDAADKDVQG